MTSDASEKGLERLDLYRDGRNTLRSKARGDFPAARMTSCLEPVCSARSFSNYVLFRITSSYQGQVASHLRSSSYLAEMSSHCMSFLAVRCAREVLRMVCDSTFSATHAGLAPVEF